MTRKRGEATPRKTSFDPQGTQPAGGGVTKPKKSMRRTHSGASKRRSY